MTTLATQSIESIPFSSKSFLSYIFLENKQLWSVSVSKNGENAIFLRSESKEISARGWKVQWASNLLWRRALSVGGTGELKKSRGDEEVTFWERRTFTRKRDPLLKPNIHVRIFSACLLKAKCHMIARYGVVSGCWPRSEMKSSIEKLTFGKGFKGKSHSIFETHKNKMTKTQQIRVLLCFFAFWFSTSFCFQRLTLNEHWTSCAASKLFHCFHFSALIKCAVVGFCECKSSALLQQYWDSPAIIFKQHLATELFYPSEFTLFVKASDHQQSHLFILSDQIQISCGQMWGKIIM